MTIHGLSPRRKLIEVALPLEAISRANRADKNRKTGTTRNLHKWFAPMPSPGWRALLAAALLDDPEEDSERLALLRDIEQLVPEDGGNPTPNALAQVQKLIARQFGGRKITVLDPFVGAGSTLIEAQRLGLGTIGGDLNPVATLITKFLTELAPPWSRSKPYFAHEALTTVAGPFDGFKADAREWIAEVAKRACTKLEELYPCQGKARAFVWWWAHVVPCPNPGCRLNVPLFASSTISAQPGAEHFLTADIAGDDVRFDVTDKPDDACKPTKVAGRNAEFECPRCHHLFNEARAKEVGSGKGLAEQLLAVGFLDDRRRWFTGGTEAARLLRLPEDYPPVEPLELPAHALGFTVQAYGSKTYLDLYTRRQAWALYTYATVIADAVPELISGERCPVEYGQAIAALLGLCVGRQARFMSKQATWRTRKGPSKVEAGFSQQVVTMVWDFAEANPLAGSVGDWTQVGETALRALDALPLEREPSVVTRIDARDLATSLKGRGLLIATDPPYFDAIGYADLSDYFYMWHRLALRAVFPDLYATIAAPRKGELIADRARHGGDALRSTEYFIDGFTEVFRTLAQAADPDLPILVVYAHQQREGGYGKYGSTGWEALLQALVNAGLCVTGSWPMHATSLTRSRGMSSNALASYIVLVCRSRQPSAGAGTRRAFIQALHDELPSALRRLQQGSIAFLDLAHAAIGPGMSVFTRHSTVVETDGSAMTIRTALALINQVRDEILSDQEGDFDSDTRFCLKWFSEFGWDEADSSVADTLSHTTNTAVGGLDRRGIFRARAGRARLIPPSDLNHPWSPNADDRISAWEVVVRLAKVLDEKGGEEAATLMGIVGQYVDLATAKEAAYLVYAICEKHGWSSSALLFDGLGTSWSDLAKSSRSTGTRGAVSEQASLDFRAEEE